MADANSPKNFSKANEVLDLRPVNAEAPQVDTSTNIEMPSLPEAREMINPGANGFENPAGRRELGVAVHPGGIISAGQNRAISEERYHNIESILSSGLEDIYLGMDTSTRIKFKVAGEEATKTINDLISMGKCSLKKVLDIIKSWLYLVPGVNKFFLEQEAKIKADKIMNLQR